MKKFALYVIISCCTCFGYSQIPDYNFGIKSSFTTSRMTIRCPEYFDNTYFLTNSYSSPGFSIFYEHKISKVNTYANIELRYFQNMIYSNNINTIKAYRHPINYLSLGLNIKQYFLTSKLIQLYVSMGIYENLMLNKPSSTIIDSQYFITSLDKYFYGYRTFNTSANLTIGVTLNKIVFIEAGAYYDITPMIKRDDFKAKFISGSISLGININKLFCKTFNCCEKVSPYFK